MIKTLLKCIAVVLVIGTCISAFYFIKLNKNEPEQEAVNITEVQSTPLYTLGAYDGRIALFKSGFAMPVEIYDVYLDSLPSNEKEAIVKGITANTADEIQKVIEDYTS